MFKGIGEKQATAIVEILGEDTLSRSKSPNVLNQVRGMNEKKKATIIKVLKSQDFDKEVLSFFMGHGISTKHLALFKLFYKKNT